MPYQISETRSLARNNRLEQQKQTNNSRQTEIDLSRRNGEQLAADSSCPLTKARTKAKPRQCYSYSCSWTSILLLFCSYPSIASFDQGGRPITYVLL